MEKSRPRHDDLPSIVEVFDPMSVLDRLLAERLVSREQYAISGVSRIFCWSGQNAGVRGQSPRKILSGRGHYVDFSLQKYSTRIIAKAFFLTNPNPKKLH